jgi:hypothetical protein
MWFSVLGLLIGKRYGMSLNFSLLTTLHDMDASGLLSTSILKPPWLHVTSSPPPRLHTPGPAPMASALHFLHAPPWLCSPSPTACQQQRPWGESVALQDQSSGSNSRDGGCGGQGWEVVVVPSDSGNGAGETGEGLSPASEGCARGIREPAWCVRTAPPLLRVVFVLTTHHRQDVTRRLTASTKWSHKT